MTAVAPGKVILTGEHAVVYGRPALVAAVDCLARAEVYPRPDPFARLRLDDFQFEATYSLEEVAERTIRANARHEAYLRGELPISRVLEGPQDLFLHLIGQLLQKSGMQLGEGFELRIRSDLPIGAGMGSSAATLAATAKAMGACLGLDLDAEALYELVLNSENLQHGRASGVDPAIVVYGGLIRFERGERTSLPARELELTLVYTGQPESSTGEAVAAVAAEAFSGAVWDAFAEVARVFEDALQHRNWEELIPLVRQNHRLLREIGVVPERVQRFVTRVEELGGGAKISGAGAVRGERAGVLLVFGATDDLPELCVEFGYRPMTARLEVQGARLV